jgi:hypothetical protein
MRMELQNPPFYEGVNGKIIGTIRKIWENNTINGGLYFIAGENHLSKWDLWLAKSLSEFISYRPRSIRLDHWAWYFDTKPYLTTRNEDLHMEKMLKICFLPLFMVKWRFPLHGGSSKSSIYRWDFPWNKPSSYWGTPIYGNHLIFPTMVIIPIVNIDSMEDWF